MIKHKYLAVTHSSHWICQNCGSDMRPTFITTHPATVYCRTEANRHGPHLIPSRFPGDPRVSTVDRSVTTDERIVCSDCEEDYVSVPAEDTISFEIREQGIEAIEVEMEEHFNIPCFFPGEDARLYGACVSQEDPLFDKVTGKLLQARKDKFPEKHLILDVENNLLVWKFHKTGLILPSERFSEEAQETISSAVRMASGAKGLSGIPGYSEPDDIICDESVVWIREDALSSSGLWTSHFKRSLVSYFHAVIWWGHCTMEDLEIGSGNKNPLFSVVEGAPPNPKL